jgi:hypothetical protein
LAPAAGLADYRDRHPAAPGGRCPLGGADAFVGGVFLSLLALAWSCYTPLGYHASEWLEKITLPITSRLAKLPLLGRMSIVSGR